jgi:hypothetical protein
MRELRAYSPTGVAGSGFLAKSLERAMKWEPHFIGSDAGSTDHGPDALGRGKCMFPREAVKRDFRLMLHAARSKDIPLLIGSAGTAGANVNLEWATNVLTEVADEEGLHFRLAVIHAEQDKEYLRKALRDEQIRPLWPERPISDEIINRASHIVGMMGVEPYIRALEEGAQVVLAGRSSDTAIFAAIPTQLGFPQGPSWHAGKILECGAAAVAIRQYPDGMMAWIREDHFIVEPPNPAYWNTPQSIASHTLYENAHPFHLQEPSGMLDVTNARYEAINNRAVKVYGSEWVPAEKYSVKLEAAEMVGYQSVVIGSIRDPVMIKQLESWLSGMEGKLEERIREGFGGLERNKDYNLFIRIYGLNGTMGPLEPVTSPAHEVCLLMEVTASSQDLATALADAIHHLAVHYPVPEWHGLITGVAYPYSPAVLNRGEVYRFSLNHVLEPADPYEMFPIDIVEV